MISPRRLRGAFLALILSLLALGVPASAAAPAFSAPGPLASDTGHILLEWEAEAPVSLIIAERRDFQGGRALYSGPNRSFFVSGLDAGEYYLRLRDDAGRQSAPLVLTVEHQSLARAIWLTIIGAVIALAIVATILRGARP